MEPSDRLRSVGRRLADPVEALAQQVAGHAVDLVVNAMDMNALLERVDLNAILNRVDLNQVLDRVDVNRLLSQIDVNALVKQIDMDAIVAETDLGAIIARSTGGVVTEGLDAARSGAVGLDQFVDRWVRRVLRRKDPGPAGPAALHGAVAKP